MSRIDSRHWKISTGRHFQNGHHNTAQIQHCPITGTFHMWVDYDVPNWFLTSEIFYRSPFSKWPPQCRTNSTLSDFNDISYVCRLWFPDWKISSGRHFQNGHHNTSQIQHFPISTTFHLRVDYVWCPESIHDIEKFLAVAIFKMATKIQHCPISSKFDMWVDNDGPTLKNFYRSPFSKWPSQYRKNSTLSDIIKIWYVGR